MKQRLASIGALLEGVWIRISWRATWHW